MPAPITDGAALTAALKASKTGEAKLAVCRGVLRHARDQGRRASAREVIEALRDATHFEATVEKAELLAAHGELPPPPAKAPDIEDLLLADAPAEAPRLILTPEDQRTADEKRRHEDQARADAKAKAEADRLAADVDFKKVKTDKPAPKV